MQKLKYNLSISFNNSTASTVTKLKLILFPFNLGAYYMCDFDNKPLFLKLSSNKCL